MNEINRINQYRFYKLHVCDGSEYDLGEINTLINDVIALHAARIGKPYISLVNKGCNSSVQKLYEEINSSSDFAYIRCMRKTLHLCSKEKLEMLHHSTKSIRIPRGYQNENKFLIDDSQKEMIVFLQQNGNSVDTLIRMLMEEFKIGLHQARELLKFHWENGLICLENNSTVFYKEERRFSLTEKKYNLNLVENRDEQFFINMLVKHYVISFGPVSMKDILWWSGLPKNRILRAIESLDSEIIKLQLSNLNFVLYIHESQIEIVNNFATDFEWCRFMGYEDCVMKGYKETRFFYGDSYDKYFNRIGEIFPTIVYNGKCVGLWNLDLKNKNIKLCLDSNVEIPCNLIQQEKEKVYDKIFKGW